MKSKLKLITTADVRDALDYYDMGEISYGKMVEMLNDAANKALIKNQIDFENVLEDVLNKKTELIYSPLRSEVVFVGDIISVFENYGIKYEPKF